MMVDTHPCNEITKALTVELIIHVEHGFSKDGSCWFCDYTN